MTFRSSPRRSSGAGTVIMGVLVILFAMVMSAWVLMLVIGNFHHAGFPIPALGFWTTFWAMSPIYVFSMLVGALKATR